MDIATVNGVELEYEVVGSGEPVLLISPVLADGFLPLLEVLPDVRGHVFGCCGHAAPLERTDEFNPLLTTFLEADR